MELTALIFSLRPGCSERMHCLLASDDMGGKILFNQDFAVWLKPEPGKAFEALCILLEVFQTWHDGTQGSGIPQAK